MKYVGKMIHNSNCEFHFLISFHEFGNAGRFYPVSILFKTGYNLTRKISG